MRILAIETASFGGTLALLTEGKIAAERVLPSGERSAQSLAPAIHSLVADHAWPISSLGLIAVAQGPGSFTGLRVGITTAKTLAYAVGAELIGVDTLETLANDVTGYSAAVRIHAAIDAQRGQLCVARFMRSPQDQFARRESDNRIVDIPSWISTFGSGDVVISSKLAGVDVPAGIEQRFQEPRAATVGRLAWRDYQAGRRDDVWSLVPRYHRPSAAEEKAAQPKADGG